MYSKDSWYFMLSVKRGIEGNKIFQIKCKFNNAIRTCNIKVYKI